MASAPGHGNPGPPVALPQKMTAALRYHDEALGATFELADGRVLRPGPVERCTFLWNRTHEDRTLELDGTPLPLPARALTTLGPGQRLRPCGRPDSAEVVLIRFDREFYCVEPLDAALSCHGLLFDGALGTPVVRLDGREAQAFDRLVEGIREELEVRDGTQGEMLRALLRQLIIRCVRLVRHELQRMPGAEALDVDLVRRYTALVERHFRTHRRVSDYARMLFRSAKTLANAFRLAGARSPHEILHARIELEARRLIGFTDWPVGRVARELGFADGAQFSRFFRKRTGLAPEKFRARQRARTGGAAIRVARTSRGHAAHAGKN